MGKFEIGDTVRVADGSITGLIIGEVRFISGEIKFIVLYWNNGSRIEIECYPQELKQLQMDS